MRQKRAVGTGGGEGMIRADIEPRHGKTRRHQVARIGEPHDAEADYANAGAR